MYLILGHNHMKVRTVILRGFRGYREEVRIPLDDFTALVGRNDVGKSTVLEALDIFFEGGVVKYDASDVAVNSATRRFTIGCEFEVPNESIVLDVTAPTSLRGEYLLNAAGLLEIHKEFDVSGAKAKITVSALALHPTATGLDDLLGLKITDLKKRLEQSNIHDERVQLNSKPSIRAALWRAAGDLALRERLVPLQSEDGKEIWESLQKKLPLYALFRADRAMTDEDSEVQDPMKLAVLEAVRTVNEELEVIREKVRTKAVELAGRTVEKLRDFDETLARALSPVFKAEPKWDGFKLSLNDDRGIPINKRGSGVRRLILLSFFRAEVERRREERGAVPAIFAIEEPEASQHPDNQKLIAETLLALARSGDSQVLISTHNPALAALLPTESLRLIAANVDGERVVRAGSADVINEVCETLGVLPDPRRAKVLVLLEGPSDVDFLLAAAELYAQLGTDVIDLRDCEQVCVLPIGGSNLQQWVRKRYLQELDCIEVHIMDRGGHTPPRYQNDVDEINNRGTRDCAFLSTRREIENYIPVSLIDQEFGIQCGAIPPDESVPARIVQLERAAATDPNVVPWDRLDDEKKAKLQSTAKNRIARNCVPRMTAADLQTSDADAEVKSWLEAIALRIRDEQATIATAKEQVKVLEPSEKASA